MTKKELELVDILKTRELTKAQSAKIGLPITDAFLIKCENHGILVYEETVEKNKVKYGVLNAKNY